METIKIINYLLGLGVGTYIFFLIFMFLRYLTISRYVKRIADLAVMFCNDNKDFDIYSFKSIISSKRVMMQKFWINDFTNFTQDKVKMKLLLDYFEEFKKKLEAAKKSICHCRWCDNIDKKEFSVFNLNKNKMIFIICKKCGASTPMRKTEQECWNLLNPYEK